VILGLLAIIVGDGRTVGIASHGGWAWFPLDLWHSHLGRGTCLRPSWIQRWGRLQFRRAWGRRSRLQSGRNRDDSGCSMWQSPVGHLQPHGLVSPHA